MTGAGITTRSGVSPAASFFCSSPGVATVNVTRLPVSRANGTESSLSTTDGAPVLNTAMSAAAAGDSVAANSPAIIQRAVHRFLPARRRKTLAEEMRGVSRNLRMNSRARLAQTNGSTSSVTRLNCAIGSPMVEIRKVTRLQPAAL